MGHSNLIIKHHCRPFDTIEEHDETLIQNYNSMIKSNDIVYCLGDFAWKDPKKYLQRLSGCWILILGNHDSKDVYTAGFQFVKDTYFTKINDQYIYMSHYAHRVWNRSHYGSIHTYGHSHGQLEGIGKSMDVGVDCNNYYPFSFEQIIAKLKDKPILDHHI
jgi:calcineurin-like phosphoesterase family protein